MLICLGRELKYNVRRRCSVSGGKVRVHTTRQAMLAEEKSPWGKVLTMDCPPGLSPGGSVPDPSSSLCSQLPRQREAVGEGMCLAAGSAGLAWQPESFLEEEQAQDGSQEEEAKQNPAARGWGVECLPACTRLLGSGCVFWGRPHIPTCPADAGHSARSSAPSLESFSGSFVRHPSSCWIFPAGNEGLGGPGALPFTSLQGFKVSQDLRTLELAHSSEVSGLNILIGQQSPGCGRNLPEVTP